METSHDIELHPTRSPVLPRLLPSVGVGLAGALLTLLLWRWSSDGLAAGAASSLVLVLGVTASVLGGLAVHLAGRLRTRARSANLARELEERTAHLAAAVDELETFNYSVSHDLRSPLGAILNFAAVLEEELGDDLDDACRGYLDRIRKNAREVVDMMDSLLVFSRVGRKELACERLDLGRLVREAFVAVTDDEVREHVRLDVEELPAVAADEALIETALRSLLENAVKFTRGIESPHVRVRGERRGPEVVLTVEDNGVGFDMEDGARLFRAFERLHDRDEFEGRGIGLAVVSRIVARHGGRAWIDSTPGEGTRVHLALPGGDA